MSRKESITRRLRQRNFIKSTVLPRSIKFKNIDTLNTKKPYQKVVFSNKTKKVKVRAHSRKWPKKKTK